MLKEKEDSSFPDEAELVQEAASLGKSMMLVHDYLLVMRGAERTFKALCDLWPTVPVSTLFYDDKVFGQALAGHPIRTSVLQKFALKQSTFKAAMPLLPFAAQRLDVSGYDLIVSSSSAFAHGVRRDPDATHVCYCHTPFRYAWHERDNGLAQVPRPLRPIVGRSLDRIRTWDQRAAQDGTFYVANGKICQQRIALYWGMDVPIVHPPVELHRFAPAEPEDYVLLVGELLRHKQTEIALQAARLAGVPVKVVGTGVDEARLKALHGDHVEFLGRVDDATLASLYARARALVMPNFEEFGITSVESQASGRPVIAARGGGALETVIEGETGLFFRPGDVRGLAELISDPALDRMDPEAATANARRFSVEAFQSHMLVQVRRALATLPGAAGL